MDPVWIFFAFAFGFTVKQIGLPPMVGYLLAGFALNIMGVENSEILVQIADLGVLLLLFTIGLKLRVKEMLRPEIWLGSSIHMLIIVLLFGMLLFILSYAGFERFSDLDQNSLLLIAFALSFSSTIFAVKILEDTGNMNASHGRIAIGVLVMQDIFAVLFLTFTSDKTPSLWAFGLLLLLLVPYLIRKQRFNFILNRSGHGELLILLGVLLPLSGAALFEQTGLKPDLGALIFGVLIAEHPRSKELANTMMGFKDLFLVGFFLSIGLLGTPTLDQLAIASFFTMLIPVKMVLFFFLFTRFKLRARTSALASFSLTNYSEFGLIVGTAAALKGWLPLEWLIIFALCISFSIILSAPLNIAAQRIYTFIQKPLLRFETKERLAEDEPIVFSNEEVLVFGMGRTGSEVYRVMEEKYQKNVLGVDINMYTVEKQNQLDRNVLLGDVTDLNFWQRVNLSKNLPLIILTTPSHLTHMTVVELLHDIHCDIKVAAISRYDDEMLELKEAGVDVVFNLYEEAGFGFADHTFNVVFNETDKTSV